MPSSGLGALLSSLHALGTQLAAKLAQLISAIQENLAAAGFAAVAGFAISIFFAWRLSRPPRPARRPKPGGRQADSPAQANPNSSTGAANASASRLAAPAASPLALAVRQRLSGAKRVTCHIPGILLLQSTPGQLQHGASLLASAAAVMLEVCRQADVYLMAQVEDDASEVAILSALEAGNILGPGSPFNSTKLLFCSTETGVMSFVRQLEPDLHIESCLSIAEQLKRFVKRELYVSTTGTPSSLMSAPNVTTASSLEGYFAPLPALS